MIIRRVAIELFQYSNAIRPDTGVAMTHRPGQVRNRNIVAESGFFDNDVIVSKAMKLAELNGSHFCLEIAVIVDATSGSRSRVLG